MNSGENEKRLIYEFCRKEKSGGEVSNTSPHCRMNCEYLKAMLVIGDVVRLTG